MQNFDEVSKNLVNLESLMIFYLNIALINKVGLSFPHLRSSSDLKASGQVEGIGKVSLFTATPYATASVSMPLYGVSPVSNSQTTTP